MENTLFLAQLLGTLSVILALVSLVRRKLIVHVVTGFVTNRALAFFVGLIEVIAGLILVLKHSVWNGTLETVISVLAWLILLEGLFYLSATRKMLRKLITWLDNKSGYYFFAALYLVLGLYLVYVGFGFNV